ncbi:protein halfway [Anoplophora glabripennis]|nr:protein halfway-like [Anoplophora glabripennis]XP_023311649.1 protein halfway-like [Anoplophora glabripennis]XP_023312490.1 protein halfway [Anoplophora glabripennis]
MYVHLIFYILIVIPTWCLLAEHDSTSEHRCFHQPASECRPNDLCRCHQLKDIKRAAVCCDVNKFTLTEGLACANITVDGQVEALHIRNATLDVLNVTQPVWKRLKYMTITDGQINSLVGEFAKLSSVSCLNLSSNGIKNFAQRSLVNLFNLSFLDLSHNNLTSVPRFKKEGSVILDISDNPYMLCTSLLDTLKKREVNVSNEDVTFCLSSKTFHWFNSTEKLPISQVQGLLEIEENCIENCTCQPYRMEIVLGKQPIFSVAVNCSGVNLLSLPTPLPPHTVSLNITNNNITSLQELGDPSYQHLMFLYADNNQISTIQQMEGTKFMSNFVVLSLKNNKIKEFETYLLSNIKFYRTSDSMRYINLGHNKLHCDCKTAKEFKVWLLSKLEHVPDYDAIGCDNMDVKIMELEQTKLCQSQQDWTDYIYYIITAEVLLLIGLIAKVSYDYWVFKTAGYLPWPASKMPKLPCDWLCE